MGIPSSSGGYPKMVTVSLVGGALVPAVFPAGHARQFNYVILNNAADEAAFGTIGVAPVSNVASGWGGSWENRHGH